METSAIKTNLLKLATHYRTYKQFYASLVHTQISHNFDVYTDSPEFTEFLNLVQNDHKGNEAKLKRFYYTDGKEARKSAKVKRTEIITQINVNNIIRMAMSAANN